MSASVELRDLSVSYGTTEVLRSLSLTVHEGELLALLGPSGCGKTTVLKTVAGLLQPDAGAVLFDDEVVTTTPVEKRRIALVFQKALLFPHMTVGANVGFGLKMRGMQAGEVARRVKEALEYVRLGGMEDRLPSGLSGGQEQRVAIARALVTEPRVLLLDEPFSALDEALRDEMRTFVRALQRQLKITTIFVTHDQEEATLIADRIALLLDGRIAQAGPPTEFYEAPVSVEVARFFGWQVLERLPEAPDAVVFRTECCRLGSAVAGEYCLVACVEDVIRVGSVIRYQLKTTNGEIFRVEQSMRDHAPSQIGAVVTVRVPQESVRSFGQPIVTSGDKTSS